MTLFFLCGLAAPQVFAQGDSVRLETYSESDHPTCQPCPPACVKICKDKTKCSAAEIKACQAAVATCTPAEVEACKIAVASCSPATGSVQTVSFTGPVQSASCSPSIVSVATCAPAVTKPQSAQVADTKAPSRQKTAKVVVSKG